MAIVPMSAPGAACNECSVSNEALAECSDCRRQLCRRCVSAAGRCGQCCQRFAATAVGASVCCPFVEEVARVCVSCGRRTCQQCVSVSFQHRPRFVICARCPPASHATNTCGRCGRLVVDVDDAYYCEVCGDILCSPCLSFSFESGVLKCGACCPSPVRLLGNKGIRTRLSNELRLMIASAGGRKGSKYSELTDRIKLGEGAQGVVYKCRTKDGEVVVLKEMRFSENERLLYEASLRQAVTMQKLSHQHLIRYLDVIGSESPLRISVIMPYYSEGDLSRFIRRQRAPVAENQLCSIVLQIATALKYLHSRSPPIAHCDIKPDNVLLLNNEEQVLLMDLDLCHACGGENDEDTNLLFSSRASPTFEYRAPEMANSPGTPKSDIFSLGVLTFVLATLPEFLTLRNGKGVQSVLSDSDWTRNSLEKAISCAVRQRPRNYREDLVRLIVEMLRHDPQERPTAADVTIKLSGIMLNQLLRKK